MITLVSLENHPSSYRKAEDIFITLHSQVIKTELPIAISNKTFLNIYFLVDGKIHKKDKHFHSTETFVFAVCSCYILSIFQTQECI